MIVRVQGLSIIGILADEADPMVSVMKVLFCSADFPSFSLFLFHRSSGT